MPHDRRSPPPPPSLGHVRPDRTGAPRHDARHHDPRHQAPPPPPPRPYGDYPAGAVAPRTRRSPDHRERRRLGLGRVLLYALGGLLLLVIGGIGLLLAFPPTGLITDRLAAEVQRQTGRQLKVASAGISLRSGLGVSMTGVELSAPPAMGGAPLLRTDRLEVSVSLLPFVLRQIKVERLSLERPVIELRIDASGRRSWDFAEASSLPVRYAQAKGTANDAGRLPAELREFARNGTAPGSQPSSAPAIGLDGLSLADVHISGGTLHYRDARAGIDRELKGIDARLSLPQPGGPMTVKGHVVLGPDRLAVNARVDAMRELLAERPVNVHVGLAGTPIDMTYDGRLVAGAEPAIEGRLAVRSPSLAVLARLAERPLTGAEGTGPVSVAGTIKAAGKAATLTQAALALGGSTAQGTLGLDAAPPRPLVTANLHVASLDLDRLLQIEASPAASAGPTTPGRFAAPAASERPAAPVGAPPAASIDDLLKRLDPPAAPASGPRVRGFRKRSGNQWETDAIDVSALRLFDLDGRFQIGELKWNGLAARSLVAAAELKDGHMRASVTDAELAGGKVRGLVSLEARQSPMTMGANLSGDGVALAPLLKAAGVDLLEGRGRTVVTLSARGASERDLVSTLGGRIELKATDGALVGWNAEALLASLARGELPSAERRPDARTPFRQLSATFAVAQGVARTQDIALDSPTVRATGAGLVNIVDQNVDITVKPKVGDRGLEVPVRIAGHWDNPSVVPDVQAALRSPQAQEAVRQLKDGNVEGALRSVLGNGPKADKKIDKAKDFLRGFFNQ